MLYQEGTPALLAHLPQEQVLRQIWLQHYFWEEGHLRLRNKDMLPPAHLTVRSPYDPHAHIGRKGGFSWYGYKVHLSETCDAGYPHLITCVQTTDATASDMNQTQVVHEELARRHVLPQTHLVDAGYVDAGLLVESHERYGVELLGPVSRNNQWQAKEGCLILLPANSPTVSVATGTPSRPMIIPCQSQLRLGAFVQYVC